MLCITDPRSQNRVVHAPFDGVGSGPSAPNQPLPHKLKQGGLADRARAVGPSNPPHAKRGGSSRQTDFAEGEIPQKKAVPHDVDADGSGAVAQTTPPPRDRSRKTSDDMAGFLSEWRFDWLSLTIPNSKDGRGSRLLGDDGEAEALDAEDRLFTWATLRGLRTMRVGKGSDGYLGAAHLAFDPTASERVATIRAGHTSNMPGMELPGANGACADLAPRALEELGAVNLSRVDVCWDISQDGLMDELHEAMRLLATERRMDPPRVDGTEERGRTIYLGKDEAVVRVYQKDMQRVAKGVLSQDEADPSLVRVEVMLRPKGGKKAGMARVARDEGPGALLGATLWVRQLVERVAVLTARVREEQAQLAVTRVRKLPDPRPLRDRAEHGARQYARTWALAEVADMVEERWEGDWLQAEVDPSEVIERAVKRLRGALNNVAADVCGGVGVLEARDVEAEAERAHDLLNRWMWENTLATERAQGRLLAAASRAREMCGVPA
jgi:hypothetical protein